MPLSPRARRWSRIAAVVVVLLLAGAWWVNRQLEPTRLTRTVLARAGAALQLDLRFEGVPEYALRPEPSLVLPNFSARGADGQVFLSAHRLEVSLPWDTLTGGEPVITRVELEAPRLDVAGLQRWLATRPKEPFKVPTLSKGMSASGGTVIGDGWSLQDLSLDLPTLAEEKPARLATRGQLLSGDARMAFNGHLDVATAGLVSDFALRAGLGLARAPKPLKAALAARGHFAIGDGLDALRLDAVSVKADSPLPSFDGGGALALGQSLAIDFKARLADWPKDWPQLPGTLAGKGDKLPVKLSYRGDKAFNGPLSLHAEREATVVDARLRVPEFMRWFDDRQGAVLPPLTGTLKTPALEFDGVKLEGVELRMSDEAATP